MANFDTKNKSVEELFGGKGTLKTHEDRINFPGCEHWSHNCTVKVMELKNKADTDRSPISKLISKKIRQREAYKLSLRFDEVDSAEELDEETLAWIEEMDKLYNVPEEQAQAELSRV